MDEKEIREIIRSKREKLKLSQKYVAHTLHVDRTLVTKWENGKIFPDYIKLKELCKILDLDFYELIGAKNKSKKKKISKLILIVLIIFAILVATACYVISHHIETKSWEESAIKVNDDNFSITGTLREKDKIRIITINRINYNNEKLGTIDEIQVKEMQFHVYSNDKIIYNSEKIINDTNESIDILLGNLTYKIEKKKNDINPKNIKLIIEIIDKNDERLNCSIDLSI